MEICQATRNSSYMEIWFSEMPKCPPTWKYQLLVFPFEWTSIRWPKFPATWKFRSIAFANFHVHGNIKFSHFHVHGNLPYHRFPATWKSALSGIHISTYMEIPSSAISACIETSPFTRISSYMEICCSRFANFRLCGNVLLFRFAILHLLEVPGERSAS